MDNNKLVSSLTVSELRNLINDCIHETGYITYVDACMKYKVKYAKLAYNVRCKRIETCRKGHKLMLNEKDIKILLGIY
jgi:hypothetical protein